MKERKKRRLGTLEEVEEEDLSGEELSMEGEEVVFRGELTGMKSVMRTEAGVGEVEG